MATEWQETLVEKQVTYTLNLNGQVILIENVPARVDEETGEQFFSPPTGINVRRDKGIFGATYQ
ncbi:MAG: hypothetical protein DCF17_19820 [Shackletoniella antarctica]|uniref:Uncharacterized protein n=1 Tax=Shackletoniella antarctica TaxID=268115 RepID=A0A2W4VQM3_9CYAN|nr:MAG: hypothetical protein DCF17_19820 [Shackletoniella antarctica]